MLLLVLLLSIVPLLCNAASRFNKKVILITGCSTGIGKAAAEAFSNDENNVVYATMRNINKSTFEIPSRHNNLHVLPLDVTSETSIKSAVEYILAESKKIDVLINNAGFGISGCLESINIKEAQELFDVNVFGVMRMFHAVLPSMRSRKKGYIINISSTSGLRGIPSLELYSSSKFALEGLADSMRYTLAAYNISVTNVNAGPVRTPFIDRFGSVEQDGKGTREIPRTESMHQDGDAGRADYLQFMSDRAVRLLQERFDNPLESQSVEDLATVLKNLVHMKDKARSIVDVPFNIGNDMNSQKLLESLRVLPTGWGGLYTSILQSVPPLTSVPENGNDNSKTEL